MKHKELMFRLLLTVMLILALALSGTALAQGLGPNDPPTTEPPPPSEPIESVFGSLSALSLNATPGVVPKTVSGNLLLPLEYVTVNKTVTTPPIPPKPDIYFLTDATGSMGSAIANVKSNAAAIMAQVSAAQPDARFGAGNYLDFLSDPYAFQNNASIGNQAQALAAINGWNLGFGGDGSEGQFYALDQIAEGVVGWRADSTRIVVWFGDWPAHDPVCTAISGLSYDITEASVTAKLVAAGIRVIAISVTTNYPNSDPGCTQCDLDGNPALQAGDYTPYCTIDGTAGQAGRIAAATGGVHFSNVSPDQVSAAILEGLTNLPATVTPQLDSACSTELDYAFVPASQTVTSGDDASFVETVTVKSGATGGLKTCTVDWLINGVSAGPDFLQSISIYVDTPPEITSVTATPDVTAVNTPVSGVAEFIDPDYTVGDTHTCTIDWGDGATEPGVITEPSASGPGTCTGTHSYSAADIYDVVFTVTDSRGLSDSDTVTVVVYDPNAGFVTGGGWIDSPVGACPPGSLCEGATGKANFGFVAKYQKGASVPMGNTEFQFHGGDLNFHSTSYEWLVVTGGNFARYKGVGTVNGEGMYQFMVWAGDGTGTGGADTFRIKIWMEDGTVVYDNGMNQDISAGSIVLHTKK